MNADPTKPGLAVVVLNYNKCRDLLLAIRSILDSDYPNFRLLVVDNCSTDDSVDQVRANFPDVDLIVNSSNSGVSKGRNLGWRTISDRYNYEYIIFLDDDTEIKNDFFSKLVTAAEADANAGVLTGRAYTSFETSLLMSVGIDVNLYNGLIYDIGVGETDTGQYSDDRYVDACGGFAFFVRRPLFEALGGFDERYSPYGWEDVDFCLRAQRKGYQTKYVADALVCHKGTKAGRKPNAGYERHKIRNYLVLLGQHANTLQKLCCLVCVPAKGVYILFEMLRTGNGNVIGSQLKGFFEGLAGRKRRNESSL